MSRPTIRLVLAAALMAALVFFGAAPSSAQEECPGPPYPPAEGTLNIDRSVVAPDDTITVSGEGFAPDTTITVTMQRVPRGEAVVLGTFQTDSEGSFEGEVTIPETTRPGRYRLSASGADACIAVARVLSAEFTVRAAAAAAARGPQTGIDALPWILVAGGVVVVGGILLALGRRRRRVAEQSMKAPS